jgi:hypothetical protein
MFVRKARQTLLRVIVENRFFPEISSCFYQVTEAFAYDTKEKTGGPQKNHDSPSVD